MPYVMTFDANGGTCETKTGDIGGGNPLRALPEPTREHYAFDGWYTAKTGGDKITIDAMPSGKVITARCTAGNPIRRHTILKRLILR